MKAGWAIIGTLCVTSWAAEPDFSKSIRTEDFSAAGLGKLTPDEIARLDKLVRDFRAGKTAQAPAIAAQMREPPAPPPPSRTVTVAPGTEVRYSTVESRIAGEFRGWSGNTILQLENGQRWKVAPGQNYSGPPLNAPAVRIAPGMLGTFWMSIEGVKVRVKVVAVPAM